MGDAIDTRTVFTLGSLKVTLARYLDKDERPENYGPGSAYDDEDTRASFDAGEWEFNVLEAEVIWDDVVIAGDSLGSVDHGTMRWYDEESNPQITECDAFEITPPDYEENVVYGGSPASSVISEALAAARKWAKSVAENGPLMTALNAAEQWADPNANKRTRRS